MCIEGRGYSMGILCVFNGSRIGECGMRLAGALKCPRF